MALATLACGKSNPKKAPPTVRLATFNAGLATALVPLTAARGPAVVTALASLPVDALCVQEFWSVTDLAALTTAAKDTLPRVINRAPEPDPPGSTASACALGELDTLYACAIEQCGTITPDQLPACIIGKCATRAGTITQSCQGCLLNNVGQPIPTIRQTCEAGGGAYGFGGSFGTALLTNAAVTAEDSLLLTSAGARRSVLYAKLETSVGPLHAFCTHLAAIFATIPYPGAGSWAAEQSGQIDAMRAWAAAKAGTEPYVLMGDMNTGPVLPNIEGEEPANFTRLATGLRDVQSEQGEARCSFCKENPLVPDTAPSVLIDHMLFGNFPSASLHADRILDQAITVTVDTRKETTAYSDHYGLMISVSEIHTQP